MCIDSRHLSRLQDKLDRVRQNRAAAWDAYIAYEKDIDLFTTQLLSNISIYQKWSQMGKAYALQERRPIWEYLRSSTQLIEDVEKIIRENLSARAANRNHPQKK